MALKENLEYVKNELNSQEQFLENMIKGERFFKKYKNFIIAFFAILFIGIIAFYTTKAVENRNKTLANEAYEILLKDPQNKEAKETLKSKSPSLYALFEMKFGNEANLQEILNLKGVDPFLLDLIKKDDSTMADFSNLMKGYNLLKDGKIKEANQIFSTIKPNSALSQAVRNLQHFQGIKNEK